MASDDINNPNDEYMPPEAEISRGPAVAASKGKSVVMLGVVLIVVALMGYLFFGGTSKKEKKDAELNRPIEVEAPTIPSQPISVPTPVFNEDSAQISVPLPPLPPAPPILDDEVTVETETDTQADVELSPIQDPKKKKRYQSNMLITGGVFNSADLSKGVKRPTTDIYSAANDTDPNIGFADSYYNQESVPSAYARKLSNTSFLITQGKIIDSVLESPINTDVPGMIRGIVSRDVYGESGRTILIPKGSRLVGTYNNLVVRGNKRVNIIWSRVIRPDGIDIMIRSPGVDQLGTAGVEGIVDNKYLEVFTSAFLVSSINIIFAAGVDAVDDPATTTQNTDGSTTQTSTAKNQAALKAIDLFGKSADNLISSTFNTSPTITIEQGTRVSVFVNRDLIFPSELVSSVQVIQ